MANVQFYNKSGRPNRLGLPDFIVRAFEFSPRDWDLKFIDNSIGVTTLMDSPKVKLLRKKYRERIKEDNDISNDVKLFFGTMAHLLIERAVQSYYADPEFKDKPELVPISEKRIVIPFPASDLTDGKEFNIVMKPDITYIHDGVLYDLKTGTTWDWKFRKDKFKTWKDQLDMYKYGIEEYGYEDMPKYLEEMFKNKTLKIKKAVILLWMKDWSASEAERESNYPEFEMVQIEISLSDNATIKKRITSRVMLHSMYITDPQQYNCTPEERWSKKTEFAVYAKAGAAKATKVFKDKPTDEENKEDAMSFLNEIAPKFPFASIVERAGLPTRCVKNYCSVADFCNQFRHENGLPSIEQADANASKGVVIKGDVVAINIQEKTSVEIVSDLFSTPKQEVVEVKKEEGFTFSFGDVSIDVSDVKTSLEGKKEILEEKYNDEDDEYAESLKIINNLGNEDKKPEINLSDGIDFNFKL